ncbi:MAG: Ig-like domain-containing protein [Gammaproteobacteria bacterium]|nr:Ig-like domain-containing protein [Gammaproteobacteria bacterium]
MTISVASAFSDPDGDALSYATASTAPGVATVAVSGADVTVTGVSAGTAAVTVTASDPGGLSAQQAFEATVPNRAPVAADSIPDQSVRAGASVTLDLAGHFSDPDGDALSYAAASSEPDVATVAVSGASLTVTGVSGGTAAVTVTASDPGGLSAQQAFEATVPNRAPVATDSIPGQSVRAGASVTLDLAGHFSDPDGDALTYAAESSEPDVATVAVSGASLTITGVSGGTATITVTASDPGGLSAQQAFEATVPNRAPVATDSIPGQSVRAGASVTLDLAEHFRDPDGDALSYAAASSEPEVATVAVSGASLTITGVSGGTATITVTASDPGGLSAQQAFQATVPNRAPVAADSIPGQSVRAGASVTLDLAEHFRDPDGDALSYAAASSEPEVATVAVSGASLTITGVSAGTATITVTASDPGGLSAQQAFEATVPNRAPAAADSIPDQSVRAGASVTLDLAGHFSDPDGDALSYAAASSEPDVATVAVSGASLTVTGVSGGTAAVTVTASDPGGLSAQQAFQATVKRLSITAVEPTVLIEGGEATITGFGFSSTVTNNSVTIDGLPARVRSASRTSLVIVVPAGDCQPPRRAELRVSVGSRSDSRTVGVAPLAQEDMALPQYSYIHTHAGDGCVHLPGSASGGEYLIGVVSTSERPSSVTAVRLSGNPGDPTVVGTAATTSPTANADFRRMPVRSMADNPARPARPRTEYPARRFSVRDDSLRARHASAHNEVMARNEALLRELGHPTPPAAVVNRQQRTLEAGDTTSLYEPSSNNWSCSGTRRVNAVVRLVGSHTIWLEDLNNPSGTFSDSELVELDALYAANIAGVLDGYLGGLPDVDGNERILILMTQEVNRRPGDTRGYVFVPDLWPTYECATSNRAEIFYGFVPDPDGAVDDAVTKEEAFFLYPSLIAHEAAHIAQFGAQVFGDAGQKRSWELEGGAVLAEHLVAFRLFGHASGQNLGYAEYSAGWDWYSRFWDMARFFGWDPDRSGGRVPYAPEQCTWIGRPSEGNSGPCRHPGSAVYGVSSMVFRYALDRWGGTYPGGEGALMRRLTQSPAQGFASLRDVSSWRSEAILADFYITLWLDLQPGLHAPGMTSWNLQDIFDRFPESARLRPRPSSSKTPTLTARVRGGSSLYVHWTPSGPLDPTSLKITTGGGGPVPGHISVWALRIR